MEEHLPISNLLQQLSINRYNSANQYKYPSKCRVQLNWLWFVIHGKVLNFDDWAFSQQGKKIKINRIINGSMTCKWYENYLNTLNTELWWLYAFFVLILSIFSIWFTIERANFRKSCSWILEKHYQTSINLTDAFNFTVEFSNYVGFHEIKGFCAFTKYTTQKFTANPQFVSMSWN